MMLQQLRSAGAPRALRAAPTAPCRPTRGALVVRRFKDEDLKEMEQDLAPRQEKKEQYMKKQNVGDTAKDNLSKTKQNLDDTLSATKQNLDDNLNKVADGPRRAVQAATGKGYSSPIEAAIWDPAFTRRREAFNGRLAMLGFVATCALESVIPGHPGPIGQLANTFGLEYSQVVQGIIALVAFNALAGLAPFSVTFSPENQKDVAQRPAGPPDNWSGGFKALLGISGWGFTKRNEIFVGRMAMLGFAAAVVTEIVNGRGPVAQVASWFNVIPDEVLYRSTVFNIFLISVAGILFLATFFPGRLEVTVDPEDDIY